MKHSFHHSPAMGSVAFQLLPQSVENVRKLPCAGVSTLNFVTRPGVTSINLSPNGPLPRWKRPAHKVHGGTPALAVRHLRAVAPAAERQGAAAVDLHAHLQPSRGARSVLGQLCGATWSK
jgi:hypothetical protein